jgi:uncharacterized protein (TIGR02466 family)
MNYTIDKWFPKSIYYVDNLHIKELSEYIKEIKKIKNTKKTFYIDVNSSHFIEEIHTKSIFKKIFKDILDHCRNYASNLGYSKKYCDSLKITNSWFNISKKGDSLLKHIHPVSLFSGAFYIKSNKDDFITFYKEDDMALPPENFNELSYEYCNYQCKESRLLIFKSNLNHSTNRQNGKEKIVISFNVDIK